MAWPGRFRQALTFPGEPSQLAVSNAIFIIDLSGILSIFALPIRDIGAWRSWLAYLHGVQGVGSSSLLAPTKEKAA